MVQYHDWVSVVRQTALSKGANLDKFEENSAIISVAAEVWNDRKAELQAASKQQAREIADGEVNVS